MRWTHRLQDNWSAGQSLLNRDYSLNRDSLNRDSTVQCMLVTSGKSFRKIRQKHSVLWLIDEEPDFWPTVYILRRTLWRTEDVKKDVMEDFNCDGDRKFHAWAYYKPTCKYHCQVCWQICQVCKEISIAIGDAATKITNVLVIAKPSKLSIRHFIR